MSISMADFDAADTSGWAHCWVTCRAEHEDALKALLNAATRGGQFLYMPVGQIVVSDLSEEQVSLLIERREDLIYPDNSGSVYVLEDLWKFVEDTVARIAPNATRQRLVAVNLSLSDPTMINKLRTGLEKHPKLHYAPIEFGET